MGEPQFLSLAEVLEIHQDQIARYGGRNGIRDLQALLSALAIPQATFDGNYLHADLLEMAAAYAFHLYRNYPFVDENKRTALASALVFLEMNGASLNKPCGFLCDVMVKVATGMLDKRSLVQLFHCLSETPEMP